MNNKNQNKHVLFIGVNDIEEEILQAYYKDDAQFYSVRNYSELLDNYEDIKPTVTICEAEMPGMDLRLFCEKLSDVPCIFVSSRDKDIERRKCYLRIKECYLTRPYSEEQVKKALYTARHYQPALRPDA